MAIDYQIPTGSGAEMPTVQPIGAEQVQKLTEILQKYKAGKARTEKRIISSENWWKLRNDTEEASDSAIMAGIGYKARSGWLHNVITSKHADAMAAYPEANLLPREEADKAEATMLSSIIPCILEQNGYERTYDAEEWQREKTGTGCVKVTWNPEKNGIGDIDIKRVNLLNVYWQPGVEDIQESRYFFHTELADSDLLEEQYPQLRGKLNGSTFLSSRFLYDDTVPTDGKSTVIECYYHRMVNGKKILHYVKYVDSTVLYATENDPQMAQRGLYDHGKYPFIFSPLYPIEGSPCGYGYVDICRNPQLAIDLMNTAFVKNTMCGSIPRYFKRGDGGGINEEEFLDLTKATVTVNGNLGEDSLRQINFNSMDGVYVSFLDRMISELRETSGNNEAATGSVPSQVTSGSAIAALQEMAGKGSRDTTMGAYRAFSDMVEMVIELIRQFYDLPRQFRIVGQNGMERFVAYSNAGLQPQMQAGFVPGLTRLPVFDIKVSAQKKNVYTKVAQNELAIQFFQLGFFNPQMTDQALMCLDLMDFDGKDAVSQKISQQGTMFQKLTQYMQLSLQLAAKAAPEMVQGLSQDIMQTIGIAPSASAGKVSGSMASPDNIGGGVDKSEHPFSAAARAKSEASVSPDGGAVTGEAKG